MSRVRVGTVAYLNAAPLTTHLDPARFEVIAEHPRAIAAALAAGEVDVALAPVAAALTDGDYRIVPGVCIGADGPVASVVIAAETPPEAWTELVLDGTSRSSVVLARLIVTQGPLAGRVRPDLAITEGAPGDGPRRVGGTVAAVVIGDPARVLPPSLERWDLAALWRQWTGLPFVFAVWVGRPDLPESVRRELAAAGRAGVAAIAERWTGDDLAYLTQNLRYPLDDAALSGLRRFAALGHRAGLLGTDAVRIYGPGEARRPRSGRIDGLLADAVGGRVPSAEELALLAREASPMALGLAAHVARTAAVGSGATWLASVTVDAADEASFAAGLAAAAAGQATAVRLAGAEALPPDVRAARIGAVASAGLQPWGLPVEAVTARDVASGLAAAVWRVGERGEGTAPVGPLPGDLPVHAELWADVPVDALVARVVALRSVPVTSVTVHLPLPAGSLVEPGRPTAATWLRAVALVRLGTRVPHVVASPETQGLDGAQAALVLGADDLGAVGVDGVSEAERELRAAGFAPVRRHVAFREVGGALTTARRVRPVAERARG